jgi:hypothetical protein
MPLGVAMDKGTAAAGLVTSAGDWIDNSVKSGTLQ